MMKLKRNRTEQNRAEQNGMEQKRFRFVLLLTEFSKRSVNDTVEIGLLQDELHRIRREQCHKIKYNNFN